MGTRHHSQQDVVVGARAAGGATALLLARMGHDVVVVERALFPSDTLSTHSISRSGVVQLARWGLLDQVLASGAPIEVEAASLAARPVPGERQLAVA
jgi:2-polyprenyl-6-methoxyphenol hydroxylase-like FAD-dependent oxidoreductase